MSISIHVVWYSLILLKIIIFYGDDFFFGKELCKFQGGTKLVIQVLDKKNKAIREREKEMKVKGLLIKRIRTVQLRWFGNMKRMTENILQNGKSERSKLNWTKDIV